MFYLPIFLGILFKIIDDIDDLNITMNNIYKLLLQTITIIIFLALSYNDYLFSLTVFISFITNYMVGGIDTLYWKLLWITSLIMLITNINSDNILNIDIINYLLIFALPISVFIEPYYIKEEYGLTKIVSRILMIIGSIIIYNYVNIVFINKILLFIIGYFITSVIFQTILLNFKSFNIY